MELLCSLSVLLLLKLAVFLGIIPDEVFGKLLALFSFVFDGVSFFFSFPLFKKKKTHHTSVQCPHSFLQLRFQRALSFIMP